MLEPLRVGFLGCGAIAPAYLKNLTASLSPLVKVMACADLNRELAVGKAKEFGIPKVVDTEQLLSDPDIEIIVNLTPAPLHGKIIPQILNAGKHVFSEKPLCLNRSDGMTILDLAKAKNLYVAGAADTFLCGPAQKCRQMVDAGEIGIPVSATGIISIGAHSGERYHKVFQGALLDLGPYYITALIQLFGPVEAVFGSARMRFPEKTDPKTGNTFLLDRASTVAAILEFAGGPVATLIASQDVDTYYPSVQIQGTEGRITLSDANSYGGEMILEKGKERIVIEADPESGFIEKGRGLGLVEMALAIRQGRQPRASGELMYHFLDTALSVYESSERGEHVKIRSTTERCELLGEDELSAMIRN